ncbi:MAG: hypothetical protein V4813_10835 [Gemmatimonadota bacterium]
MSVVHRSALRWFRGLSLLATAMLVTPGRVPAQSLPREVRVEVRDRGGRMLPGARIDFLPGADTALTDSTGVARAVVEADSTMTISVRKIGFEPRAARFAIGRAPAFLVRVALGDLGARLPEVSVIAEYPGEPWRRGYEERKRRASGSFRDRDYFTGPRQPMLLDDWFNGIPGTQMTSRGLRINRCPRLGVWIDGMHVTRPGLPASMALMQLTATDIAAVEIYRMAQQQAQFSDPNLEDCSLVVWTRSR